MNRLQNFATEYSKQEISKVEASISSGKTINECKYDCDTENSILLGLKLVSKSGILCDASTSLLGE